jgi:protein SCO1/2
MLAAAVAMCAAALGGDDRAAGVSGANDTPAPVIEMRPTADPAPAVLPPGTRVDPDYPRDRLSGALPDFSLTDQQGRTVTKQSLLGTPWVANFIFSTCPTHCPATLNELFHLQRRLEGSDVRFVTITVDPMTDTVAKLSELSKAFGADPERWLFLTGDPAEIQKLIMQGFQQPMESSPMRLAHSLKLMHVDGTGHVVGQYHYDYQKPADGQSEVNTLREVLEGKIETPIANRFMPALSLQGVEPPPGESTVSTPTQEDAPSNVHPAQPRKVAGQTPAWVEQLRTVNALLNGAATVLLLLGFAAIKSGRVITHKRLMLTAFATSVAFLICYLTCHAALHHYTGKGHKPYAGSESLRDLYYAILWTHIALAAITPVLAIITIRRGLAGDFDRHRRIAKVTFPIWLYVSVTGVIIYFMNAA